MTKVYEAHDAAVVVLTGSAIHILNRREACKPEDVARLRIAVWRHYKKMPRQNPYIFTARVWRRVEVLLLESGQQPSVSVSLELKKRRKQHQ